MYKHTHTHANIFTHKHTNIFTHKHAHNPPSTQHTYIDFILSKWIPIFFFLYPGGFHRNSMVNSIEFHKRITDVKYVLTFTSHRIKRGSKAGSAVNQATHSNLSMAYIRDETDKLKMKREIRKLISPRYWFDVIHRFS